MRFLHAKQMEYESICQHVLQRSYLISKGLWSSLWLDWNETLSLSLSVFTARRSKVFWQRKKQSYKCHWRDITSMHQLFPTHSYNSVRCECCQSIIHVEREIKWGWFKEFKHDSSIFNSFSFIPYLFLCSYSLWIITACVCDVFRDDPSTVNITDEMSKGSFGNTFNSKSDSSSKRCWKLFSFSFLTHFMC